MSELPESDVSAPSIRKALIPRRRAEDGRRPAFPSADGVGLAVPSSKINRGALPQTPKGQIFLARLLVPSHRIHRRHRQEGSARASIAAVIAMQRSVDRRGGGREDAFV